MPPAYLWDARVSIYLVRHRAFEPYAGRFVTRDPIRYWAGSSNLYEYVHSSPLYYTDPDGLLPIGHIPPFVWDLPVRLVNPQEPPGERWVKAPDDVIGIPGGTFRSWGHAFRQLKNCRGDATCAVISCHANAKDGPHFEVDGVKHRLPNPRAWPQEWVDSLDEYDEVVLYCCYVGDTDFPQRVANRIGKPVRTPGHGEVLYLPVVPTPWLPSPFLPIPIQGQVPPPPFEFRPGRQFLPDQPPPRSVVPYPSPMPTPYPPFW